MTPTLHNRQRQVLVSAGCLLVCALQAGLTQAQGVYRIVGPDGKVTFSDQPPPNAQSLSKTGSTGAAAADSRPNLPFELQQLVAKYPVTLYSSQGCGPCDSGRSLLVARGVPFSEKTVNTNEDITAFTRINPDGGLPLLLIGGQQIKGFSGSEWGKYLDAAGYPTKSALPAGYRPPAAQALVPLKTAAQAAPAGNNSAPGANNAGSGAAPAHKPTPPTVNPNNPAGIKF